MWIYTPDSQEHKYFEALELCAFLTMTYVSQESSKLADDTFLLVS